MARLFYVSHPEVVIDPAVPVPEWGLTEHGQQRATAMLDQPWVPGIGRLVSSAEHKAVELAEIVASALGVPVEQRPATGETDRSATGFVPHEEHERLAEQFFGSPAESASGWERAVDVQRRVVAALADVLADGPHDVMVAGHGGAGTLLFCHLADVAVDRRLDQPSPGHVWCFDRAARVIEHWWHPIDDLTRPAPW